MSEATIRLPSPRVYPERKVPRETVLDRAASYIASVAKAATSRGRGQLLSAVLEPVARAGEALRGLNDGALAQAARVAGARLRSDATWPLDAVAQTLAITRRPRTHVGPASVR